MSSQAEIPSDVMYLVDALPSSTRSLALAVRKVVLATLPDIVEVPDVKARVIGYGYGTGYKDMVASIILSNPGVKLGLSKGASLEDPSGFLEGTGKVHRYIAFSELPHFSRPAIKSLLPMSLAAWRERSAEDADPGAAADGGA